MNDQQTYPRHGTKDPETGLFFWNKSTSKRWVTLEQFEKLQIRQAEYQKKSYRKKKGEFLATEIDKRKPVSEAMAKHILGMHKKGKSLIYIATVLNMRASKIQSTIKIAERQAAAV